MKRLISNSIVTGLCLGLTGTAAAIPVFDSANYAQNVMTAARTLQQINQQIQSLQNEAEMLLHQKKNLLKLDFPELAELQDGLRKIDQLMMQAKGIGFNSQQLDKQWAENFSIFGKGSAQAEAPIVAAKRQLELEMSAFYQAMSVQSRIAENIASDTKALALLSAKSSKAEGGLQAAQATNQLLTLAAKQQSQIQSLMAAQFRAQSIEQARRGQIEYDARAATKRFLGDGKAWSLKN